MSDIQLIHVCLNKYGEFLLRIYVLYYIFVASIQHIYIYFNQM
jgi:hypothetical protein